MPNRKSGNASSPFLNIIYVPHFPLTSPRKTYMTATRAQGTPTPRPILSFVSNPPPELGLGVGLGSGVVVVEELVEELEVVIGVVV
jgi:hypothetical protein